MSTPKDEQTVRKQFARILHDFVIDDDPDNVLPEMYDDLVALLTSREAKAYRRGQVDELRHCSDLQYIMKRADRINFLNQRKVELSLPLNKKESES